MFPSIYNGNKSKCTFDSKEKFTTNLELALARNQVNGSQPAKVLPETKAWLKQPPDFSYKLYISPGHSNKLLKKPKVVKKVNPSTSSFYEELHKIKSSLSIPRMEHQKQLKIITRFPRVTSYDAQLLFVKLGKFKHSKYKNPQPHDFRQLPILVERLAPHSIYTTSVVVLPAVPAFEYESEIPDFVTSYTRDPLNLKFKSQCLSEIHGVYPLKEEKRGSESKGRFITYKPKELKWDSKLFLPKEPWPTKSGSFTRHKGQQSPRSAFIERVEETLSKLWLKEASQNQAQSRKKAASGTQGEVLAIIVSSESDSETEEKARRQQETSKKSCSFDPHLQRQSVKD